MEKRGPYSAPTGGPDWEPFDTLNQKTPAFLAAPSRYICSEYVAKCFDQIGVHTPWDGRGFIAPCDFAADPDVSAIVRVTAWRGQAGAARRDGVA